MANEVQRSFDAIGTRWEILFRSSLTSNEADQVFEEIRQRIEVFDKTYSRFRDDSLISDVAKNAGAHTFPSDAPELFELYQKLYQISGGAFTPLIGQTLSDAGYDADYSLRLRELHHPPAWQEVMEYRLPTLTTTQPVLLDFGAAGKGHLVDIIAQLLEQHDITEYVVDGSGDIRHRGSAGNTLKVGLENPVDASTVFGTVELGDQSLCGSASNRRSWGDLHHIIDPDKLTSPKHIQASWVVAEDTLVADALATCLFLVSPARLQPHFKFEYLVMSEQGQVAHSDAFPVQLFV